MMSKETDYLQPCPALQCAAYSFPIGNNKTSLWIWLQSRRWYNDVVNLVNLWLLSSHSFGSRTARIQLSAINNAINSVCPSSGWKKIECDCTIFAIQFFPFAFASIKPAEWYFSPSVGGSRRPYILIKRPLSAHLEVRTPGHLSRNENRTILLIFVYHTIFKWWWEQTICLICIDSSDPRFPNRIGACAQLRVCSLGMNLSNGKQIDVWDKLPSQWYRD